MEKWQVEQGFYSFFFAKFVSYLMIFQIRVLATPTSNLQKNWQNHEEKACSTCIKVNPIFRLIPCTRKSFTMVDPYKNVFFF